MEKDREQQYIQFQLLQQQIEQVSQQLELVTQRLADLEVSQDAVRQLEGLDDGREMIANLAPGIFMKASVRKDGHLLVNVGADVVVEKSLSEVADMLDEQKKEMEKAAVNFDAFLQEMTQEALQIYKQLEKEQ